GGVRVRDALRHSAHAAATAGRIGPAAESARRVWRVLVPVVHAPPRGATGERVVRGEECASVMESGLGARRARNLSPAYPPRYACSRWHWRLAPQAPSPESRSCSAGGLQWRL